MDIVVPGEKEQEKAQQERQSQEQDEAQQKGRQGKKTARVDMQVSVKKLFYLTFYAFDNIFQLPSPQMWLL